jgi:hypothetical protein
MGDMFGSGGFINELGGGSNILGVMNLDNMLSGNAGGKGINQLAQTKDMINKLTNKVNQQHSPLNNTNPNKYSFDYESLFKKFGG